MKKTMNHINYIQNRISRSELLAQLAEECAEMAQAALKLRRTMNDENPTPVSREDAEANLIEEHADVNLVLMALGWQDKHERQRIVGEKAERWAKRLGDAEPKRGDHSGDCPEMCPDCICVRCMMDYAKNENDYCCKAHGKKCTWVNDDYFTEGCTQCDDFRPEV